MIDQILGHHRILEKLGGRRGVIYKKAEYTRLKCDSRDRAAGVKSRAKRKLKSKIPSFARRCICSDSAP